MGTKMKRESAGVWGLEWKAWVPHHEPVAYSVCKREGRREKDSGGDGRRAAHELEQHRQSPETCRISIEMHRGPT